LKKSFFLNLDFEFLFSKDLISTLLVFKRERPEFKEKIELILELIEYGYENLSDLKYAQNANNFNYSPHLFSDVLLDKQIPPTLNELKKDLVQLIGYRKLSSAFHLNKSFQREMGFFTDTGHVDYIVPSVFGFRKETISTSQLRDKFTRAVYRVTENDKKIVHILGYSNDRSYTSPRLISDFMKTIKFFWLHENAEFVVGKVADANDSQYANLGDSNNICRFKKSNSYFEKMEINRLALVYQKIGGILAHDTEEPEYLRVIFAKDKEAAKKEFGEEVFQNMNKKINLYQ